MTKILTSTNESTIKDFYDNLQFPGHYKSLEYYSDEIKNPYLRLIDNTISAYNCSEILDVGCGTGLISNLIASRYPHSKVSAIDFAEGIHYGKCYSEQHGINNVDWIKCDFLDVNLKKQFDVVICQGVLHHIPNWIVGLKKLKQYCRPNGIVIIGLYHPWGKILKKYFRIHYRSEVLNCDQENNPFELSFDYQQVNQMFSGWQLLNHYPSSMGLQMKIDAMVNSRNGGLITYVWKKR